MGARGSGDKIACPSSLRQPVKGKLPRHYLQSPVILPLASVRYAIGEGDKAGGSGANFIVTWSAGEPVVEPWSSR